MHQYVSIYVHTASAASKNNPRSTSVKDLDADDYNEAFDNDLFTYESLHLKGGPTA